jgi:hypothetical protein
MKHSRNLSKRTREYLLLQDFFAYSYYAAAELDTKLWAGQKYFFARKQQEALSLEARVFFSFSKKYQWVPVLPVTGNLGNTGLNTTPDSSNKI